MFSAEEYQASLDRFLQRRGKPAVLQRRNAATVTMSANVTILKRGYAANELVAGTGIVQGDSRVILSRTDLVNEGWIGNPRPGDFLLVDGALLRIVTAPVRPMDIGFDLQCRG